MNQAALILIFGSDYLPIQKETSTGNVLLFYVDDLFAINENTKAIMDSFSMHDPKDTVRLPTRYLGANVGEW